MERHGMERHADMTVSAGRVVQGSWMETERSGTTDPVWSRGSKARIQRFVTMPTQLAIANRVQQSAPHRYHYAADHWKLYFILPYGLPVSGWQCLLLNQFITMATPKHSLHKLAHLQLRSNLLAPQAKQRLAG